MRVTEQSVHGGQPTPQRTTGESSRQSFVDTLASVSSTPAQKAGAAHSEERDSSENHSSDSAHNQDQNSNSFSLQSNKNQETSNKAQQGESVSHSTQQADSTTEQPAEQAASKKGSPSVGVRKSDGQSSKKAAFTVQVAAPFMLQASTAQPELSGMFSVAAIATGTGGVTSKADSPEQSIDAQFTNAISGQGSSLQGQAGAIGPIVLADVQNLQAEQDSEAEQVSGVLKAARSTAEQVELELASTEQASDSKTQGNVAAQLSTASAASDANSVPVFNPTSMLQARLAAETRKDSAARPGDGSVNQPTVKAIQSKVSGSAFGLNSDAGDATKTTKSGDAHDDRSSAHIAGVASVQTLSTQSSGAHGTAAEVKSGDANALQPVLVAVQAEVRGTAGAHTTAGSIETTAHRGNGSEGPTYEELNGSESAGISGISAARLIQTMGASEMRVGMHSSEFGDISIRTTVSQQQMETQISVDHNELGNALSAHIPNMQAKLGSEYGLHATIEVNQSGASFSSDGDRSHQHQQKARVRPVEAVEGPAAMQNETISLKGSVVASNDYRLDIRA